LGSIDIFTMLILPIHEHGRSWSDDFIPGHMWCIGHGWFLPFSWVSWSSQALASHFQSSFYTLVTPCHLPLSIFKGFCIVIGQCARSQVRPLSCACCGSHPSPDPHLLLSPQSSKFHLHWHSSLSSEWSQAWKDPSLCPAHCDLSLRLPASQKRLLPSSGSSIFFFCWYWGSSNCKSHAC
jgi:hypothetical protein